MPLLMGPDGAVDAVVEHEDDRLGARLPGGGALELGPFGEIGGWAYALILAGVAINR